ncbi:transcription termination/antitermination factor NusG [Candidatus Daviesbacteria bacterium]|nr:transcription termination/antitermination factor NusG [Candidatus Daviesbacteria bacterium]
MDDNQTNQNTIEEQTEESASETPSTEEQVESNESDTSSETETPSNEAAQPADDKKSSPNAKWYVVHTYSGHENKVAHTLKQRIESEHLENKILDVLVPMQDKIEIKGGKKLSVKEKIFPGYILVKMVLDDTSWLAVRTTQGVTSFVGMGNKPTPISDQEVQTIVKFTQTEAPMYKQVFSESDTVKIVDGPFADFIGKIDSVDQEKGKVRVLVSIFGRETPVELDFLQVQKI